MTPKFSDIKLCYFGGSGGFIILHLLLLSKKFFCKFQTDKPLSQIINDQWNITNPSQWKSTEHRPDRWRTQEHNTDLRKIYVFCNPTIQEVSEFAGQTVLLYTDAESQLELSFYKKANIYMEKKHSWAEYYRYFLKQWQAHYDNIKDPSWPKCQSPRKFCTLSRHIQSELLINQHTGQLLDIPKYADFLRDGRKIKELKSIVDNIKVLPNGKKVLNEVYDFFPFADISLNLQDTINDLDLLSEITGSPTNQDQENLRRRWVSLHTTQLLEKIGIQIRC